MQSTNCRKFLPSTSSISALDNAREALGMKALKEAYELFNPSEAEKLASVWDTRRSGSSLAALQHQPCFNATAAIKASVQ